MNVNEQDLAHLRRAIALSREALRRGDKPYAAVLVDARGQVLHEAQNTQVSEHDPTAHAELNLVREAARRLGDDAHVDATIYASGEPCAMCAGAIYWSGAARVVFALAASTMDRLDPGEAEPALPGCRTVLSGGKRRVGVAGPLLEDEAQKAFFDQ